MGPVRAPGRIKPSRASLFRSSLSPLSKRTRCRGLAVSLSPLHQTNKYHRVIITRSQLSCCCLQRFQQFRLLLDQSQQRASRARWSFTALLPAPDRVRRNAKSIGKLFLSTMCSPSNSVDNQGRSLVVPQSQARVRPDNRSGNFLGIFA